MATPVQAWPDDRGNLHPSAEAAARANLSCVQFEISEAVRRAVPRVYLLDFEEALRAVGIERLRALVAAHDAVYVKR